MGVDVDLPSGARHAYRKKHRMHARPLYAHADEHAHAHAAAIATTEVQQVPSLLNEQQPQQRALPGTNSLHRRRRCHPTLPCLALPPLLPPSRGSGPEYCSTLAPSNEFDYCALDTALWARATPSVSPGGPSHRLFPSPASLPGAMHVNSTTATMNPQPERLPSPCPKLAPNAASTLCWSRHVCLLARAWLQ